MNHLNHRRLHNVRCKFTRTFGAVIFAKEAVLVVDVDVFPPFYGFSIKSIFDTYLVLALQS